MFLVLCSYYAPGNVAIVSTGADVAAVSDVPVVPAVPDGPAADVAAVPPGLAADVCDVPPGLAADVCDVPPGLAAVVGVITSPGLIGADAAEVCDVPGPPPGPDIVSDADEATVSSAVVAAMVSVA